MIIEFKVANYRSINEEQTLSFVADRATRHPDNLIKRPGYRLLKAVGLFGANASGKSNIVRALGAMAAFVRDSATRMNDGDRIEAAEPYRLDPESRNKPSRFEVTFVTDGTVYTYGFAADRERVHEEWLSAKAETGERELFGFRRRSPGPQGGGGCEWGARLASAGEIVAGRTRENGLLLSVAARENVPELLPVFRFLSQQVAVYEASGDLAALVAWTAGRCREDGEFRRLVEGLLGDADTGVESLAISAARGGREGADAAPEIRARRHERGGTIVEFDFAREEAQGTRRLFGVAGALLGALVSGSFLVMDGLDTGLHPLLTRKLLELFQSPDANPNGAQLLFTTHDGVLLDSVLFRRDQVWLAENHGGGSVYFALADIEPRVRNTASFLGNYLAGRYGGTPRLGPAFDMVETGGQGVNVSRRRSDAF